MKVRVLGCDGGASEGSTPPAYLLGRKVAFDAGSLASRLSIADQRNLESVILSHIHHDHILSLPFVCDNRVGAYLPPLRIYALAETIHALTKHVFNDVIWPDFTRLPSLASPSMEFHEIKPAQSLEFESFKVRPFSMDHTVPCIGVSIETSNSGLILGADSRSSSPAAEEASRIDSLGLSIEGLVVETSFPDRLASLASDSGHMTPSNMTIDLEPYLKRGLVAINHIKPDVRDEVILELSKIESVEVLLPDRIYELKP